VTGVQTCALPIACNLPCRGSRQGWAQAAGRGAGCRAGCRSEPASSPVGRAGRHLRSEQQRCMAGALLMQRPANASCSTWLGERHCLLPSHLPIQSPRRAARRTRAGATSAAPTGRSQRKRRRMPSSPARLPAPPGPALSGGGGGSVGVRRGWQSKVTAEGGVQSGICAIAKAAVAPRHCEAAAVNLHVGFRGAPPLDATGCWPPARILDRLKSAPVGWKCNNSSSQMPKGHTATTLPNTHRPLCSASESLPEGWAT